MLKRLLSQQKILSASNPYEVFQSLNKHDDIDQETASTLCNVYAPLAVNGKYMELGGDDVMEHIQGLRRWYLWNIKKSKSCNIPQETELMLASLISALDVVQCQSPGNETDYGAWLEILDFIQALALRNKTQVL